MAQLYRTLEMMSNPLPHTARPNSEKREKRQIKYDRRARPRPSPDDTNFMFVQCDGFNGRVNRKNVSLAKLHRHVMLQRKPGPHPSVSSSSPDVDISDTSSVKIATPDSHSNANSPSPSSIRTDRAVFPTSDYVLDYESSNKILHSLPLSSSDAIPLLLEDDFTMISRWYLGHGDDPSQPSTQRDAFRLWTNPMFDMCRQHPLVFQAISLLTLHKKQALSGTFHKPLYFQIKHDLYRTLRAVCGIKGVRDTCRVAAAISFLCYAEFFDGQSEIARNHFKALPNLVDVLNLPLEEWIPVVFCDLRLANKSDTRPSLPFGIPPTLLASFAKDLELYSNMVQGKQAMLSSILIGQEPRRNDLFASLYALARFSNRASATDSAPVVAAYIAEYTIEILTEHLGSHPQDPQTTLFLLAARLHVLVSSYRWLPSTPQCRQILIHRAIQVLSQSWSSASSLPDLHENKTDTSLYLWTLFTLTAVCVAFDSKSQPVFTSRLSKVMQHMGITTKAALRKALKSWPWIDTWHEVKLTAVWRSSQSSLARRWIRTDEAEEQAEAERSVCTPAYFAGVLVFFNV